MIKFLTRVHLGTIILFPALIVGILLLSENSQSVSDYYEAQEIVDLGMWGTVKVNVVYNQIIGLAIILLNALLINRIFSKQNLHEHSTLLPGITYVLLLSLTHTFYSFNGDLIFQTFLIIAFTSIFQYDFNQVNYKIPFNIGFFMGLGATFSPLFFLFFPIVFIIDVILRPFKIKYLMFYLSGWLTPQIYLFTFFYLSNQSLFSYLDFWDRLYIVNLSEFTTLLDSFVLLIAFILSISSSKFIINSVGLKVGKELRTFTMFAIAATIVSVLLFINYQIVSTFQWIVVPSSILLSASVLKASSRSLYHLFFIILMIYSVVKFFFN